MTKHSSAQPSQPGRSPPLLLSRVESVAMPQPAAQQPGIFNKAATSLAGPSPPLQPALCWECSHFVRLAPLKSLFQPSIPIVRRQLPHHYGSPLRHYRPASSQPASSQPASSQPASSQAVHLLTRQSDSHLLLKRRLGLQNSTQQRCNPRIRYLQQVQPAGRS